MLWNLQKRSFTGIFQNKCPSKFHNIHRKTLALEFLFNKVAGLKAYNFIKKRLRHRCIPANTPTQVNSCIPENSFLYRTPLMAASGFLTKLAENNCEENHFSVEFFSEIS